MISTVITKRTFEKVMAGERVLYFRHKPHWDRRLGVPSLHRALILLSGRRCKAFSIETVKDTGGSYEVQLGSEISFWTEQKELFPNGKPGGG